ncbi:MAG TPA: hypothetical protein VFX24_01780 [Ktedonobacterales bacterium]|nr:hypothetical protein [Ktedonobacterales bacterium]
MREELANAHPLAQAISDLPLESGHVQIFATESTPVEDLLELRGNPNPYLSVDDLRASWQAFEDFTANYLGRGGRRVLIMGDPYTKRERFLLHLQRMPLTLGREWTSWCICGDYIGFYVTETADERRIRDFFDDVQALTTFGILTHDVELPLHGELLPDVLEQAVVKADYILVGAYEFNGMLIWSH